MRIADPEVASPVVETFAKIDGLARVRASGSRRCARRTPRSRRGASTSSTRRRAGSRACSVAGRHELEIVLAEPYPQILYWFAMPFTAPVPWEAVALLRRRGRARLLRRAPGRHRALPARALRQAQSRIVLERNPNWYGAAASGVARAGRRPIPREGEPERRGARPPRSGLRGPRAAVPRARRVPAREGGHPRASTSSCRATTTPRASCRRASTAWCTRARSRDGDGGARHAAREDRRPGRLLPRLQHGRPGGRARRPASAGRKLRQAMSLVDRRARVRARLHERARRSRRSRRCRPGIFGYDADYRNPFRQVDLERATRAARARPAIANGIDPATGKPLHLTFDIGDTVDARARALPVLRGRVAAGSGSTSRSPRRRYNQFQDKVRKRRLPDLHVGLGRGLSRSRELPVPALGADRRSSKSGGPNTANFADPRYDALFVRMKVARRTARSGSR